jgi:phosphohistidine phosphatase SixA
MQSNDEERYVLLVRHAARERRWDRSESEHDMLNWCAPAVPSSPPTLSDAPRRPLEGKPLTYSLAGQLADQLAIDGVRVQAIYTSRHRVAQQTGQVFSEVLAARFGSPVDCSLLDELTPQPSDTDSRTVNAAPGPKGESKPPWLDRPPTAAGAAGANRKSALLVVGHQPQLTEIAKQLLGGKLPAGALPLANSEIACIRAGRASRLCWLLTEKPADLRSELERKIQSKLDVAKFFLAAITLNFGLFLETDLWGKTDLLGALLWTAALLSALASFGLTVATLYSYDRLAMPRAFWGGARTDERGPWTIARPPSQDQIVLFYEMTRVWREFFTPAMVTAGLALALLVILFAAKTLPADALGLPAGVVLALLAGAAAIAPAIWYARRKPRLGVDD